MLREDVRDVPYHRLDHECVVSVDGEVLAVGVKSVADVPSPARHERVDSVPEPRLVALSGLLEEKRLDFGREQQPVGFIRLRGARLLHACDDVLLHLVRNLRPYTPPAAHEPLREKGRVNERLALPAEGHLVGRARTRDVVERLDDVAAHLRAKRVLGRIVVRKLEPRTEPRHDASERLYLSDVVSPRSRAARHGGVKSPRGEVGHHGVCDPDQRVDPERAVRRSVRAYLRGECEGRRKGGRQLEGCGLHPVSRESASRALRRRMRAFRLSPSLRRRWRPSGRSTFRRSR